MTGPGGTVIPVPSLCHPVPRSVFGQRASADPRDLVRRHVLVERLQLGHVARSRSSSAASAVALRERRARSRVAHGCERDLRRSAGRACAGTSATRRSSATSVSGSPRRALGQSMTTGPRVGDHDHVQRVQVEMQQAVAAAVESRSQSGAGIACSWSCRSASMPHASRQLHVRPRSSSSIIIGPSMRSITISVPPARTSSMRGTGIAVLARRTA